MNSLYKAYADSLEKFNYSYCKGSIKAIPLVRCKYTKETLEKKWREKSRKSARSWICAFLELEKFRSDSEI